MEKNESFFAMHSVGLGGHKFDTEDFSFHVIKEISSPKTQKISANLIVSE